MAFNSTLAIERGGESPLTQPVASTNDGPLAAGCAYINNLLEVINSY